MFDELFEILPDAMIVVACDGRILRANAQAQRLFGYAEKELLGAAIEMLMPERARRAHEAHRAAYTAHPRMRPMGTGQELTGLKRDGQQFPVEIALSPLDTPGQRMFVASIRDVSETQRARQAVARQRYDACVARIGQIALAAADMRVAILDTPELIAQALGADGAVIALRTVGRLEMAHVHAAYGIAQEVLEMLPWPLLPQGEEIASSESAISLPGFRSHALVPLIDHGEAAGSLLVLSKIEREFDRDAMHFLQSVANLLAVAMQRIRLEEQLSHGQRLEAVGQLTGGIAHDFNNLLTVISGNLQILEEELADRPDAREIAGNALRAVGRGADLTRKLLAFARRQRLAPRACDPQKLLGELGTMLRRTLGEGVQLTIHVPAGIAPVFVDPSQLDTALLNLALNARDAMPRGGLLTIGAEARRVAEDAANAERKPGHYIAFSVRDTGHGMEPEVLARAFEPFFTTKEHGKGNGLGLSMVYGFVKQSGGHVHVESRLGYGTCVELHLPAAEMDKTHENVPRTVSSVRGKETILVVEDEDEVREIAVAFLRSLGYSVLATPRAEAALEILAAHEEIALLFSDVTLGGGMDGVELAGNARRLRPALGVLLTSGYEHSNPVASTFQMLPKPYRREELSTAVRAVLDEH